MSDRPSDRQIPLEIRLLGPFDMQLHEKPLPRLRSRKGIALLALLILRHGREVEREWLAGMLWPGNGNGRALLRRELNDLRKVLMEEARRITPTPTTMSPTLRLNLEGAWVDLLVFDAAIARNDPASLREAVALYRGPFLEGCLEEWALQEQQVLEQAYLQALEQLTSEALSARDWAAAANYSRRIVAIEPLRESAHRSLMQAMWEQGDPAEVMQVYHALRKHLHEQILSEPTPETRALFERIREQARLRLKTPSGGSSRIPSKSSPHPLTPLLGREEAIASVIARLRSARLVTLTGIGGIGKTRLAIRLMQEVAEEYPDGVRFVDLAPLQDPNLVAQAVASTLGLQEQAGRSLLETLAEHLSSRSTLLILDNCEHLLDACARLTTDLLTRCPHLRILATSREPFGIPGEAVWRVPPLAVPADESADPMTYDAIRLFMMRASEVKSGFALNESNAPSIIEICRRLDGIPLALELAAAWVRSLSVQEIAARLDDRFRLLTGGSRTAPKRHQTLRATLDGSFDLLDDAEKTLLERLSVFVGGWTLKAAESVCGDGGDFPLPISNFQLQPTSASIENRKLKIENKQVLFLLTVLLSKSLVECEERNGETRYRFLETIRQYAHEKLSESGETESVRTRHLDYFFGLAKEATPHLLGSARGEWMGRLKAEIDNMRTALVWAFESDVETGWQFAVYLWRFWALLGHPAEGRHWLEVAPIREGETPRLLRAEVALARGHLAFWQGEHDTVPRYAEQSLTLFQEEQDRRGIASAHELMGLATAYTKGVAWSREHYEAALALFRELDDKHGMARTLDHLGYLYGNRGERTVERRHFEESLTICEELVDQRGVAAVHDALGILDLSQGNYSSAEKHFQASFRLCQEHDPQGAIFAGLLVNMGHLALRQGKFDEAEARFNDSLSRYREMRNRYEEARMLAFLGELERRRGDRQEARIKMEQGLKLMEEIHDERGIAETSLFLGKLEEEEGNYSQAERLYDVSLRAFEERAEKRTAAIIRAQQGHLAARQGDFSRARALYAESLPTLYEVYHARMRIVECLEGLAVCSPEHPTRSAQLLGAAEALREAMGAPRPPCAREAHTAAVSAARTALGDEAFAAAFEAGRALTMEETMALAMEACG